MEAHDVCSKCDQIGFVSALLVKEKLEAIDHEIPKVLVKGAWHQHDDKNEYLTVFECDYGHVYERQITGKPCWCGWLPPELVDEAEHLDLVRKGVVVGSDDE